MAPRIVNHYFLEHPRDAGQTYFQHLRFAWRFGASLFGGACAAFAHGVLPNVHRTTASETVKELHARLQARHAPSVDIGAEHVQQS
jgi:hypothetical protein